MIKSEELKEMLKTREPLEVYDDRTDTWGRYAYVKEVVTKWDDFHKRFIVLAVCKDVTLRSSVQQTPDKLRRITRAADEKRPLTPEEEAEKIREIQQRTLETIREAIRKDKCQR